MTRAHGMLCRMTGNPIGLTGTHEGAPSTATVQLSETNMTETEITRLPPGEAAASPTEEAAEGSDRARSVYESHIRQSTVPTSEAVKRQGVHGRSAKPPQGHGHGGGGTSREAAYRCGFPLL